MMKFPEEKYEGLGYLAGDIEKDCFVNSKTEKEYHESLARVLLSLAYTVFLLFLHLIA